MSQGMPSRTISTWVARDPASAYAFLAAPQNFPRWASGLCTSIGQADDGRWIAQTPHGPMTVRFTDPNPYGVLDHHVVPPSGPEIYVPLRLLPNAGGSEIFLILFRQPDMSDETFESDAAWVQRDLAELKRILEAEETRSGEIPGRG